MGLSQNFCIMSAITFVIQYYVTVRKHQYFCKVAAYRWFSWGMASLPEDKSCGPVKIQTKPSIAATDSFQMSSTCPTSRGQSAIKRHSVNLSPSSFSMPVLLHTTVPNTSQI